MRKLVTILLGCLALAGCGGKQGDERTQASGGLTAQFAPVPDPPQVGHDSAFAVTLAEGGQPVRGASVQAQFVFKGLNQQGPSASFIEASPGRYEANEVSTGMNGKWEAQVTITRAGKPAAQFTFPFAVAK